MSSQRGPMSPSRAAETLANGLAADVFFCRRARQPSSAPRARGGSGKSRRNRGSVILRVLKRLWIPLVVLVVIGVGGMTVSRLHGIFGSEKSLSYADTRVDDRAFQPQAPEVRGLRTTRDRGLDQLFRRRMVTRSMSAG